MLTSFQKTSDALFYEVLSIPLPEYEAKKSLKVSWHNRATEEVKVVHLLLNKEGTVGDALAALSKEVPTEAPTGDAMDVAEPPAPRRLRMMEVFNHRIYKIFQEHEEIDN